MAELSALTGAACAAAFANLLRAAHGEVFPLIAEVRAETAPDAVRAFAKKAASVIEGVIEGVIETDLNFVEDTGLVDFATLDEQARPNREPAFPVVAPLPPATSAPAPGTRVRASSATSVPAAVDTGGGVNVGLAVAIRAVEFAATLGVPRLLRST
ncbi:hypothetical protein [Actinophytocola sp.]|jgi:hypothetical protein|uniref:hypothetical protein n=1 Tax=Actinophytocola sp. TaxID=1872138 RepID=UPI002ED8F307